MKDWKEWFISKLYIHVDRQDENIPNGIVRDLTATEDMYHALLSRMIDEGYIKPKTEHRKKKAVAEWLPDDFEYFWHIYPKPKSGRSEAVKEWNKLKPNQDLIEVLFSHPSEYYATTEPQFMLDASRYLKRKKWNDEIIKVKPKLLAVPKADDTAAIDKFVTKHDLPKATTEKDYWEYRGVLVKYIEDKQLMASSA